MSTTDEVRRLIDGSGHNFHARVARWFSEHGWTVSISPYYMDQTQNKARELDLVAEKGGWSVLDDWGNHTGGISVRLFVECKFVPGKTVFWFCEKNQPAAKQLVCSRTPFKSENAFTAEHHYLATNDRVAKLFETSNKGAKQNKPEQDPFYKALNQVLNAMTAMSGRAFSNLENRSSRRKPFLTLEYPVIICNEFDRLYEVDFFSTASQEPRKLRENFQLEVQYAYLDRYNRYQDEYFLLDILEFEQLEAFEKLINRDAEVVAQLASV